MKIKKTFQGSLPENRILNTSSSSQTDTYSCDYINDSSVVVSATEPTTNRKKIWIQKGKNLFDGIKKMGLIDKVNNGIIGSSSVTMAGVNFIPVKANVSYTISATVDEVANTNSRDIGLYDLNKNLISTVSWTMNPLQTVTIIPVRDGFMRVGFDVNCKNIMVEQNPEPTEYEEYIEPKIYIKNENDVYEEFMNEEESLTKESINKLVYASSDFSDHSNFGGSYYYKIGSRVHLHIGMNTEKTTSSTIATLPEIYRPSHSVSATGIGNNINDITFLRVSSDGNIDVQTSSKYALIDIEYDIFK